MRLTLPWPLRRFLLGALLCSVTMATAASGAEFVVDAAQATNPGQHVYNTLQELADSGALSSGDTVILHNDDSSLTAGLPVAVNFRSNDPPRSTRSRNAATSRTPARAAAKSASSTSFLLLFMHRRYAYAESLVKPEQATK